MKKSPLVNGMDSSLAQRDGVSFPAHNKFACSKHQNNGGLFDSLEDPEECYALRAHEQVD